MDYYNKIKDELVNNETYKRVKDYSKNRNDLKTYYNVGKLLNDAGKHYGEGIIKKYSDKLTNELGKKFNETTLKRIRQFYSLIKKGAPLVHQLTWSHYQELLPLKEINKINYYINICQEQNLSKRKLREKIKNNEYERLDDKTKLKLINKEQEQEKVEDFIKNPILIKNKYNKEDISERMLQRLILEDMPSFLKELGNGFCFIDNEYPIKIGKRYNYIDLLLYNINFNCYVVCELKTTELKKEHIGQFQTYMNYIDKNVKTLKQSLTIGIIICKKDNKFVMKYVADENVFDREYQLI